MIVRSYTGRTVREALDKVREDLGEQALIIETRSVTEPGLLGRKIGYEVVAAIDGTPADQAAATAASQAEADLLQQDRPSPVQLGALTPRSVYQRRYEAAEHLHQPSPVASAPAPAPAAAPVPAARPASQADALSQRRAMAASLQLEEGSNELGTELAAIRRQIARLTAGQGTPTSHLGDELTSLLEDQELPAEVIAECDEACQQAGERLQPTLRPRFVRAWLDSRLTLPGALDWNATKRLLVVGPTGVGKTTTIAKLAGDLVLNLGRKVGLISVDTYRVGGADQLRAYAELLDMPFAVAESPEELNQALELMAGCDNVLIDTAGRNPGDAERVGELRTLCRATPGLRVLLTVSATCGRAEFAGIVERFSVLPVESTIITKLDECRAIGRLYGCLRRHKLPVNYLTTGQEVPDDYRPATASFLSELLFTQDRPDPQAVLTMDAEQNAGQPVGAGA